MVQAIHEWLLCEWYRCFLLCCSWYPSRISHLVLLLFYFHGLRWVEDSRSLFNNTVVCLLWNVSFYQLESLSYLRKEGGFPGGKEFVSSAGDARDESSILWSDRSPGEGNDNPLQYFCLEDSMDRGAWQATVQGVAKSWTWLSNWDHITWLNFKIIILIKEARPKNTCDSIYIKL